MTWEDNILISAYASIRVNYKLSISLTFVCNSSAEFVHKPNETGSSIVGCCKFFWERTAVNCTSWRSCSLDSTFNIMKILILKKISWRFLWCFLHLLFIWALFWANSYVSRSLMIYSVIVKRSKEVSKFRIFRIRLVFGTVCTVLLDLYSLFLIFFPQLLHCLSFY